MEHDLVIHGTCHKDEAACGETATECPEEGDDTEHIPQLVVLTYHQDGMNLCRVDGRALPRADKSAAESNRQTLYPGFTRAQQ